jgi:glutamine phosphoribosylpyrophosphate amidotransferase
MNVKITHSMVLDFLETDASPEEIQEFVLADSLVYLSMDLIRDRLQLKTSFCDACFTGKYPVTSKDRGGA